MIISVAAIICLLRGRPNLFIFHLIESVFGKNWEGGENRRKDYQGKCNRKLTNL
jgi:hypothetical protein